MAQEVLRLSRAVEGVPGKRPGLAEVLGILADTPHQILRTDSIWTRADRARRPIASQLPRVVSAPNNITEERKPRRVIDGRVEHTVDVMENRLLKLFVAQVRNRIRRVQRLVGEKDKSKLAEDLNTVARRFVAAEKNATFLNDVSLPATPPTGLTMVLLKRPPYRAALEGWLEFNRSQTVRIEMPSLDAPLENLPSLYESWGALSVIETVLKYAEECGYKCIKHQLVRRKAGELVVKVLPNGTPALVLAHPETGKTIHVVPQLSYGKAGEFRSISLAQKPDISTWDLYPK